MNTNNIFVKLSIFVALAALALAACMPEGEGNVLSGAPQAVQAAQAQAAPAPAGEKASGSLISKDSAAYLPGLTKFYGGPDRSSGVVDVLTPSEKPLAVVGRSEDGGWLALAPSKDSREVIGWAPAGEVDFQGEIESLPVLKTAEEGAALAATTAVLAKVYAGPDLGQEIQDIVMAGEKFNLVGRSADGRWLAVSRPGDEGKQAGWIPVGELKIDGNPEALAVISGR